MSSLVANVVPRAPALGLAMVCFAAVGCGDALLPSDFSGPPADKVGGVVLDADRSDNQMLRPRMHVAWLTSMDGADDRGASLLTGQQVTFQRSEEVWSDWDIGLSTPAPEVALALQVGSGTVTVAIGKMVWFDDRVADNDLDWSCDGSDCDRVMAISNEFVVYVERTIGCESSPKESSGGSSAALFERTRLAAGYHYFVLDGNQPVEIDADGALNFLVEDRDNTPRDSDPTSLLQSFTTELGRKLRLDALEGC